MRAWSIFIYFNLTSYSTRLVNHAGCESGVAVELSRLVVRHVTICIILPHYEYISVTVVNEPNVKLVSVEFAVNTNL